MDLWMDGQPVVSGGCQSSNAWAECGGNDGREGDDHLPRNMVLFLNRIILDLCAGGTLSELSWTFPLELCAPS